MEQYLSCLETTSRCNRCDGLLAALRGGYRNTAHELQTPNGGGEVRRGGAAKGHAAAGDVGTALEDSIHNGHGAKKT